MDIAPVIKGDWVERRNGDSQQFARVTDSYFYDGAWLIDVCFYSPEGQRLGRLSPRLGGPSKVEPALPFSEFQRIKQPRFPMQREVVDVDGFCKYLYPVTPKPNRTEAVEKRVKPVLRAEKQVSSNNFDYDLEITSRRLAYEKLFELHRSLKTPEILEEARKLQMEADILASERDELNNKEKNIIGLR